MPNMLSRVLMVYRLLSVVAFHRAENIFLYVYRIYNFQVHATVLFNAVLGPQRGENKWFSM